MNLEGNRVAAATRMQPGRQRIAGVTLLELMAVVVVIGVLSAIAIPSYRQYSMRAQRTEAKTALLQLATSQERYYLQNRAYGSLADLALAGFTTTSENGVYTLAVGTAGGWAVDYWATAIPTGGGGDNGVDMTADAGVCGMFRITSAGVRTSTPHTDCW
jgi:type IV pilus assembly protein PilE